MEQQVRHPQVCRSNLPSRTLGQNHGILVIPPPFTSLRSWALTRVCQCNPFSTNKPSVPALPAVSNHTSMYGAIVQASAVGTRGNPPLASSDVTGPQVEPTNSQSERIQSTHVNSFPRGSLNIQDRLASRRPCSILVAVVRPSCHRPRYEPGFSQISLR